MVSGLTTYSRRLFLPVLLVVATTSATPASAGIFFRACTRLFHSTTQFLGGGEFPAAKSFRHEGISYSETIDPNLIPNGTLVEGSVHKGGFQPHYRVDLDRPEIKSLIDAAKGLGGISREEKISWVIARVQEAFPTRSYTSKTYLATNAKSLFAGTPVAFSSYLKGGAGVCRENALLTKILLDAADIKSKIRYAEVWRMVRGVRTVEDHQMNLVLRDSEWVVVDPYFEIFNGKSWRDLNTQEGVTGLTSGTVDAVRVGVVKTHDFPIFYVPKNPVPAKEFEVNWKNGATQKFEVLGRSPAEKAFAADAEIIENAGPEEMVPIEWLFLPLYGYTGHSAVRVGDTIYEFTNKGWQVYDEGQRNARAYLYNNPFLKRKAADASRESEFPFSLGVPLSIEKSALMEWMRKVEVEKGDNQPFSFLQNNCNHSLLRGLRTACPNFNGMKFDKFELFSSVLTFKKLVKQSGLRQEKIRVYPLPGKVSALPMQERLPYYLDPIHSEWNEGVRIIQEVIQQKFSHLRPEVVEEVVTPPLPSLP